MSMFIGEALEGEGNEVAHIDLMIGDKDGPVGAAFAHALANQNQGHSNLLAVLAPNLDRRAGLADDLLHLSGVPVALVVNPADSRRR